MPKLVMLTGADVKDVPIKSELTMGRSSNNDLPLNEENASRNHAKIVVKDKKAKLIDLDSSNGTRVNGMKIKEKELTHGDTIAIGKMQLIYQDDANDLREGSVIGGYKLTQKLGEGGMGTVFRATQLSMDRSVAIKVLKKELCDSREFVKSFLREARLAGQLNHAGIIQVHEVSQFKEVIYFSMEFVEGKTALELIEKEGKVQLGQALEIVIAVAEALAYADSKGIIHRDIKPANIIVTKAGDYKLADLGLAGGNTASGKEKGKNARVMGTPNYIAPEQSENKELDIRADIYALGATFFHLLTGHPPFSGPNTMAIITQHHTEPRPKVRKEVPACPKSVDDLIEKMMAIDKKDRPANAKDLLEALKDIKTKEQTAIRKSVPKSPAQDEAAPAKPAPAAAATAAAEPASDEKPASSGNSRRATKVHPSGHTRSMTATHKPTGGSALNSFLGFLVVLAFLAVGGALTVFFYGPEKIFPPDYTDQKTLAQQTYDREVREANAWNDKQKKALKEFTDNYIHDHTAPVGAAHDPVIPPPVGPGVKPLDPPVAGPDHVPDAVSSDPVEVLKATNAVCDAAQKKLDKLDLVSARRMLTDHLAKYGSTPQTGQATALLNDVTQHIDTFLDTCLTNVREKSKTNDFASAATWGSKAIGLDTTAKQTLEVKSILGSNDLLMQTPCQQAMLDGREKINNGDFQGAQKLIGQVLARANGTCWTPQLRSLHLEALYGDRISKKLNTVLTEAAKNETPFVMTARGIDQGYSVTKLTGFKVATVEGPVMKISSFSDQTMDNWVKKIPNLDAIDHLALGIFMDLAGLQKVATTEILKASRDRTTASDAIAYQTSHNMIAKFKFYDFMDWKQQLDWDVQSGSWAFQDQRFECQSPDIGEVDLNPEKAAVVAQSLTLSWVAWPKSDKSGFIVDVFQDATHRIGVALEDGKVRLDLQAGDTAPKSAEEPLVFAANKPVEFSVLVKGDDVTLTLPAPNKPITAKLKGVGDVKGKLRIQILSGTTAFDDILIQN